MHSTEGKPVSGIISLICLWLAFLWRSRDVYACLRQRNAHEILAICKKTNSNCNLLYTYVLVVNLLWHCNVYTVGNQAENLFTTVLKLTLLLVALAFSRRSKNAGVYVSSVVLFSSTVCVVCVSCVCCLVCAVCCLLSFVCVRERAVRGIQHNITQPNHDIAIVVCALCIVHLISQ